ncbi:MAG: TonB-dependent receptor [Planctomycetota bacterium]|nr:MAG: TonB-dependent receptor [Planctomycetota bacterium]
MRMSRRIVSSLFRSAPALAAALLVGARSVAQDTGGGAPPEHDPLAGRTAPRFVLDEILVTATRSTRTGFSTPYSSDAVDASLILDRSYRTTPEALRDIPGVMVQKTSHGQGSPFIRGFTGFRNVFLIDGVRLNNSVFRDGPNQYWNTVDPLSLDRLEIVKGPSSVLYGSDAIGGTVAAFTKTPYSGRAGAGVGGRSLYRFSSGERSHVWRGEVSVTPSDTVGALVGLSLKDFGDVEAGSPTGRQPNTGYGEYDADAKAEFWLDDNARLVFAHQTVRQNNVPRTHRTVFAKPFAGTTVGSDLRRDLDQERRLTYVQYHADALDGAVDAVHLNLSWQRQLETRGRIRGSGASDTQGFEVGSLGVWAQLASETALGRLTYGVEWYRDFVDSFSSRNPIQGPVGDDAVYDLVGVYLQDEFEVGERTAVVLGGRINYARASADRVQDPATGSRISVRDSWSAAVGSLRLTQTLVPDRLNLFAGVSQGFRAPNLSDLTRLDSARTNEIETPSIGLDPERFLSYEIGLKTRGPRWAAQASYFYTDISDLIIRTPTGNVIGGESEVTKLNSGDGFVQGVEFGARVRPHPQWTVFGHLAWIDGEVDTFPTSTAAAVREPLSRLMPLNGQVGLRFDHPSERFWIEGALTLADRADRLSSRDIADTSRIPPGGTPGYEVLSIRSGWRLRDNIDLTVALENLTDANYRVHGSGQNEPGRSLVVGLEITF